jgi:hypothetical protein
LVIYLAVSLAVPWAAPIKTLRAGTLQLHRQFKVMNTKGLPFSVKAILICLVVAAVTLFGDVTHVANQTYNTASGAAADGVSAQEI